MQIEEANQYNTIETLPSISPSLSHVDGAN